MMKKFETPLIPLVIFGICYLVFTRLLFVGFVPTSSMEPTISAGSLIVGMRVFGELKVGDIIVFEHEGKRMVKRIAAVPGDVVVWDELEYADGLEPQQRDSEFVVVPEGCYFVLGDNVQDSWDSRYWEEVFVSFSSVYFLINEGLSVHRLCDCEDICSFNIIYCISKKILV